MVLARDCLDSLEAVRVKDYATSCCDYTTLSISKSCALGLEYNAESEISLMHTFDYYSEVSRGTYG